MRCYDTVATLSELALQRHRSEHADRSGVQGPADRRIQSGHQIGPVAVPCRRVQRGEQLARIGNVEKARPLLDIAAKDPALDKQVAELRKIIGGG
jgi:hypothetical protein